MKKKKLEKKLVLNKETIAGINQDEMKKIEGGFSVLLLCTEFIACSVTCSIIGLCCIYRKKNG